MSGLLDAEEGSGHAVWMSDNRVRTRRDELGMAQKDLAAHVGVSRQSLNAIETQRTSPGVALALKLARALESNVEALFGTAPSEELEATLGARIRGAGTRVLVGRVRDHWIAQPLSGEPHAPSHYAADGFVRGVSAGRVRVELTRASSDLSETVFVSGCAPGLGVLTDRLEGAAGPGRFRWLMQANNAALRSLERGHAHVVGVHLPDNMPHQLGRLIARHLPTERGALYAFARWEAGLVVAPGNPARVRDLSALHRPRLRVALREEGSGARTQLMRMLRTEGVDIAQLTARSVATYSHMAVAQAVQLGAADVGFTIRAAALAFQLDFVPLIQERFDLAVPDDLESDVRVLRLLEMLGEPSFRRELGELGYDAAASGELVSEVRAG